MNRNLLSHVIVLIALAAPFAHAATTQPADDSPLPTDPADIRGQFPNGLHYLIRHNANPPGKVYLNLAVRSGAFNETPQQNGLAHFLEHMAFKGSTHYAPTRMIPMLTHLGMQFGADTNAHTNQFETVFKLTMPDVKPETTELALTIFSDYANGLSLFPVQIDSERRVILEEARSRTGAARREQNAEFAQLFPGTALAMHDVLGDPAIIQHAPQPLFADYWNTWYRPEKMTLVVVGDIDPQAIIEQAKPLLGTFTARAPARPSVDAGVKPFDVEKAVIISDPEQVTGELELVNVRPARPAMTTYAQFRRRMTENFAVALVNRRLSDLAHRHNPPFQKAGTSASDFFRTAYLVDATASGEPQDWGKALGSLIYQLKLGCDDGFTQHEWDLVKNATLARVAESVNEESTLNSGGLVTGLTTAIDTDKPMMSSPQELDLLKRLTSEITPADLQQAFAADFRAGTYAYVLRLPAPTDGHALPSEQEVLSIANSAWKRPTTAATTRAVTDIATLLPADPAPGKVAARETDADLQLTTITFDNGVILHHKFSDYKKSQVMVELVLPGGVLQETADNRGISSVASMMLNRLTTRHLTSTQIRDLLSDKNVSIKGSIGLDSMAISINGSPADVPLGLKLINGLFTEGRLDPLAVEQWKKSALQSLRGKSTNASAQLSDAFSDTVMGGDVRFAPLTPEVVERQLRTAAQIWFKHIVEHAPIEVTVVGDISEADATAMVAKYLGSLPKRTGTFEDLDPLRHLTRPPGPYTRTVRYNSTEPKALVMTGFVGCDEHDPARRPLALATLILSDRMIQHIRFEQQLVYSISCRSTLGRGLPGTGLISASSPTDPHNADRLADAIHSILTEFAANGPTEDEVATAKKQMANELALQMKDPAYWVGQFAEFRYHHRSLAEIKQVPEIYQTFTATQIRDAVRTFATDDRSVRIEVLPNEAATTAPAN